MKQGTRMNEPTTTSAPTAPKKQYAPPTIQRVCLRPEEAVLGFCKNNTGAGPRGGGCKNVIKCNTQGS